LAARSASADDKTSAGWAWADDKMSAESASAAACRWEATASTSAGDKTATIRRPNFGRKAATGWCSADTSAQKVQA
jgi:hypothetical protein